MVEIISALLSQELDPWTKKEIKHQEVQIATLAKINGGAVCGLPQTIITSKKWAQREEFLSALKAAL